MVFIDGAYWDQRNTQRTPSNVISHLHINVHLLHFQISVEPGISVIIFNTTMLQLQLGHKLGIITKLVGWNKYPAVWIISIVSASASSARPLHGSVEVEAKAFSHGLIQEIRFISLCL